MAEILLGTSGWSYKHWKTIFYPESLSQKNWLEFYSEKFNTVELNAPFYRIPSGKAVASWDAHTPDQFKFSVKMNQLITHRKKLRNCQNEINWFFSAFTHLNHKIAVILIQIPPNLAINISRLDEFFSILPVNYKYTIEFRNASWYTEETFSLLKKHKAIFCIHDMPGSTTPRVVTSNTIYIRFHGYDTLYGGNYPNVILEKWAEWIKAHFKEGLNVYGYFNNDIGGFAIQNCHSLKNMI